MTSLATRRSVEFVAMMMIGDGILAAVEPARHARLWEDGPPAWRSLIGAFARHPLLTAGFGVAEAGLGLWLALRQSRAN